MITTFLVLLLAAPPVVTQRFDGRGFPASGTLVDGLARPTLCEAVGREAVVEVDRWARGSDVVSLVDAVRACGARVALSRPGGRTTGLDPERGSAPLLVMAGGPRMILVQDGEAAPVTSTAAIGLRALAVAFREDALAQPMLAALERVGAAKVSLVRLDRDLRPAEQVILGAVELAPAARGPAPALPKPGALAAKHGRSLALAVERFERPRWIDLGSKLCRRTSPVILGVGVASDVRNPSLARHLAESRARAEIAKLLEVEVRAGPGVVATRSIAVLGGVVISEQWQHPLLPRTYALAELRVDDARVTETCGDLTSLVVDHHASLRVLTRGAPVSSAE